MSVVCFINAGHDKLAAVFSSVIIMKDKAMFMIWIRHCEVNEVLQRIANKSRTFSFCRLTLGIRYDLVNCMVALMVDRNYY